MRGNDSLSLLGRKSNKFPYCDKWKNDNFRNSNPEEAKRYIERGFTERKREN